MADNDITTISISAKAETGNATKSLNKLASALERVQNISKSGIGGEVEKSLQALSSAVSGLSSAPFPTTLPKQIMGLGKSLSSFNENIRTFDLGKLKEINIVLQSMAAAKTDLLPNLSASGNGQAGAVFPDQQVAPTQSVIPTEEARQSEEQLDNTSESLIETLNNLNDTLSKVSEGLEGVSKNARKTEREVKAVGNSAKQSTSKLSQFFAAMKRIAMYRAMRAAIKAITNAFREGISNLYQFSVLIDGTFKDSMDSLATSALYLKNSLGAMVAPIVNALAPVIDMLVDKFVDLLNVFNQFIARITGASTWTKALKYPKQYAENMERAGGAAKELRATLLGFDEINRLDDLRARGGGGGTPALDYSEMFEEVELTKKTWSEMFEDLLESGKSKFALWAAGLAGILSLKLSGGLTGVFGGAAGSASLLSGFTATMLAAFAGFSLGNWMYQNDVGGVKTVADDLMENGLGETITNVLERLKKGWKDYTEAAIEWGDTLWKKFDELEDKAIEWGDKLNTFFGGVKDGWGLLADEVKEKWRRIFHPYSYEKQNEYGAVGMNWTIKPTADLTDFQKQWWKTLGETGLVFDGSQYQIKAKFLGDETEIVDWWNDHRNELGAGGFGGGGGNDKPPVIPEVPKPKTGGGGGNDVFNAIENGMKDLVKTANGIVAAIPSQSYVPAYYTKKAKGGSVETGDMFLANENGPELIAKVGHNTQVANNDQITESIRVATAQGNAEGNAILRQAVTLLNGILLKDNTVVAEITTDSITSGLRRQNLRNGSTTVSVGG